MERKNTEKLIERLNSLIEKGENYLGEHSLKSDYVKQVSSICGWYASVINFCDLIFKNKDSNYRNALKKHCEEILKNDMTYEIHTACGVEVLKNLRDDMALGLIVSLENKISAEAFDDFLEHAEPYIKEKRHKESGVIVGIVFEDTVKKIAKKYLKKPTGKLHNLINALKSEDIISKSKSKIWITCADLRTNASHADWDEYNLGDVENALRVTREALDEHLEN